MVVTKSVIAMLIGMSKEGFKEQSIFQNYKRYSKKISYRFTKVKWSCWILYKFLHDRSSPGNVPHVLVRLFMPESENTLLAGLV